jgi:hypothetical protein
MGMLWLVFAIGLILASYLIPDESSDGNGDDTWHGLDGTPPSAVA